MVTTSKGYIFPADGTEIFKKYRQGCRRCEKIYFSDTGILNLVAKVTDGQLLETAVANQLANYGELSFYNKRNKSEIDFILNKEIAFEVKQKGLVADYKRLQNLAGEIGIERQYLISNSMSVVENAVYPWFL